MHYTMCVARQRLRCRRADRRRYPDSELVVGIDVEADIGAVLTLTPTPSCRRVG